MNTYIFSNFVLQDVILAFNLKRDKRDSLFQEWQNKSTEYGISDFEKLSLAAAHKKLLNSIDDWNEMELQLKFIGKIVELVDFDMEEHFVSSFAERKMEQKINGAIVKGTVDWMVARGQSKPMQPFFFIHEYKRSIGQIGDPAGQLLSTMYVAQLLNKQKLAPTLFNPKPVSYSDLTIYGCYIIGKFWHFVILKEKDFYISKSYDATDLDELDTIIHLLKAQKDMIIDCVKNKVIQ